MEKIYINWIPTYRREHENSYEISYQLEEDDSTKNMIYMPPQDTREEEYEIVLDWLRSMTNTELVIGSYNVYEG